MIKKNKQLRILFTGPTGVEQGKVIDNLASYVQEQGDYPDHEIGKYKHEPPRGVRWPAWLDAEEDDDTKRGKWAEAFSAVCEKIEDEDPRLVFLSLHATLSRQNRIVSFVDLNAIKEFDPHFVITLIDDIYSIWRTVNYGREDGIIPTSSYFTLQDIARWRWEEVMVTDNITNALRTPRPNYIVAIKHPIDMLYKLLFRQSENLIMYASIPITKPRAYPEKREEIDRYRERLHNNYIVFDPLAIDEEILTYVLTEQYPTWYKDNSVALYGKTLIISSENRWPTSFSVGSGLKPLYSDWPNEYPIKVDAGEAVEVCRAKSPRLPPVNDPMKDIQDSVVDQQIKLRDFRLIADSQALAAWRPLYEGKPPGGQVDEIDYARLLASRKKFDIVIYHDLEKDGTIKGGPFPHLSGNIVYSEDEIFKRLEQFKANRLEEREE